MDADESDVKNTFKNEMDILEKEAMLSPEYRRKKTIMWCFRTIIAIILFYVLWDYKWTKYVLMVYIPLSLFSLFAIYGFNTILKKKMNSTRTKIETLDTLIEEEEE